MTSSVKVSAHCAANKEVVILCYSNDTDIVEYILNNGETRELYIYDSKSVETFERDKV